MRPSAARSTQPRPSRTSRVAASRSGPGSRSPSGGRPARTRGVRLARRRRPAPAPGSIASRRSSACAAHEQLDGQDPLDVARATRPRLARRDRAHRDVVLLVRAGRDRIGRRRDGPGTLFSEASAAAVYWRASCRCRARTSAEEGGSPPLRRGSSEQRGPPLADRAELGERELGEVERQRDRLAVEVAAAR